MAGKLTSTTATISVFLMLYCGLGKTEIIFKDAGWGEVGDCGKVLAQDGDLGFVHLLSANRIVGVGALVPSKDTPVGSDLVVTSYEVAKRLIKSGKYDHPHAEINGRTYEIEEYRTDFEKPVAVLVLEKRVKFNRYLQPLCLPIVIWAQQTRENSATKRLMEMFKDKIFYTNSIDHNGRVGKISIQRERFEHVFKYNFKIKNVDGVSLAAGAPLYNARGHAAGDDRSYLWAVHTKSNYAFESVIRYLPYWEFDAQGREIKARDTQRRDKELAKE